MGSKRDSNALECADRDDSSLTNKRPRKKPSSFDKREMSLTQPLTDLTYGQRYVFLGPEVRATVPLDDDLEFEDEGDALAYLQSVRYEASGIPHLLVAPKLGPQPPPDPAVDGPTPGDYSMYYNRIGDSHGYYEDGAYTAAPDQDLSEDEEYVGVDDVDAEQDVGFRRARLREAYYNSLLLQFVGLRRLLHREPPPSVVDSMPRDHEIEVGPFGPRTSTFRVWTNRIRYTDPLPAQIAAMNKSSVLKLLRIILGGKFFRRGYELRERTSLWIWSLLARLPDRGELDYVEEGWIRELGKRAVLMLISITQMAELKQELGDERNIGGSEVEDGESEFVEELVPDEDDERIGRNDEASPDDKLPPHVCSDFQEVTAVDGKTGLEDYVDDGEVDMDIEDGEVSGISGPASGDDADIAAAKERLLAQLEVVAEVETPVTPTVPAISGDSNGGGKELNDGSDDEARARLNMQATLNMILTVLGEFYGQRDLLEFRNPFSD
ncbi:hypothetical protein VTK73DRAFT_5368 [Phialemonium thermophilum]|uniref:Uncharacterized protein n=1 Tax=Phialemonium thermophilum TaxID=223376 RepID=A0ABR3Y8Y3_9PEZI